MGFFGAGHFSSDSQSSQKTDASERTNNTVVSGSNSRANSSAIGGVNVTNEKNGAADIDIVQSDHGAIEGALNTAGQAITGSFELNKQLVDEFSGTVSEAFGTVDKGLDFALTRSGSEGLDLLKTSLDTAVKVVGILGAGFVIFYGLRAFKK